MSYFDRMHQTQFRITPEGLKAINKKLRIRSVIVSSMAVVGGILLVEFGGNVPKNQGLVGFAPYFLVVLVLGFTLYRTWSKQAKLFSLYLLRVEDDQLIREMGDMPVRSMRLDDITNIVKRKNGDLIVNGVSAADKIWIPAQLERINEVEEFLQRTVPFAPSSRTFDLGIMPVLLASVGMIAVMGTFFVSTNKAVVSLTGLLLLSVLGYSFYSAWKNEFLSKNVKRLKWVMLPLIFSILYTFYLKLFL
ncbi:MAG: hypothetical protein GC178_05740 [Flavobacteriales bacterium]|nr:hypothetical protein [Flavobacteriales bacterium]